MECKVRVLVKDLNPLLECHLNAAANLKDARREAASRWKALDSKQPPPEASADHLQQVTLCKSLFHELADAEKSLSADTITLHTALISLHEALQQQDAAASGTRAAGLSSTAATPGPSA